MFTDIPLNTNIQILLLTLLGPNNVEIAALNEPIPQLEKTFNKTKIYNKKNYYKYNSRKNFTIR